jgi:hypothetical protein
MTELKIIINKLMNDEITFTEASTLSGVSKEKLEELMEQSHWHPSIEKLIDTSEIEKESMFLIDEIIKTKNKHPAKRQEASKYSIQSYSHHNTFRQPCFENVPFTSEFVKVGRVSVKIHHENFGFHGLFRTAEGVNQWT